MTGDRRRGFTLIELLVVLAIIASLLTIALPRYLNSVQRGQEAVLKQDLHVMRDALQKYYADRSRYPESLERLVEERYLREIPVDPITESRETWIGVPMEGAAQPAIGDVRSGSEKLASDGSAYREW